VTGTVTFEDKPLPAGRITFFSGDSRPNGEGNIKDGQYEVDAPLGVCKVSVETSQLGMRPGVPGVPGIPMPGKTMSEGDLAKMKSKIGEQNPEMGKMFGEVGGMFVEIPEKYEDAEKSGLTHTVTKGSSEFPITLTKPPGWKPHKMPDRPAGIDRPPGPGGPR
jgi:hypothetical protein